MKKEEIKKLKGIELSLLIYDKLKEKKITRQQAVKIINYWRSENDKDVV